MQDAGLPILRSIRILQEQQKPGRMKNSLMDVCDEIEAGATLSEAMSKCPKAFDRLYVNMIRAGEAGGALETILRRLAEFQERAEALKRKVKGAMVYPIVVVLVAVGILTFIMIKIVPAFVKIFADFKTALPTPTVVLMHVSNFCVNYWFLIPGIPLCFWLFIKLLRKFPYGRAGWDLFIAQSAGVRQFDGKEHDGPHHAHLGHAGGQRRADFGSAEHYPRNLRQRHVRTACTAK